MNIERSEKTNVQAVFKTFEVKEFDPNSPLPISFRNPVNPERVIRFRASDETTDRCNEVILASGWDLSDYSKNPVVMQFHDYDSWPLGFAVGAGIIDNALFIDSEFDPPDVDESADMVFKKIKHGTVRSGSVGFVPKDYVDQGSQKALDYKDLFEQHGNPARIYLQQTLLEWTICPVPANPNALAASLKSIYAKRFGATPMPKASPGVDATYEAEIKMCDRINKMLRGE